jgi:hypothetical protein
MAILLTQLRMKSCLSFYLLTINFRNLLIFCFLLFEPDGFLKAGYPYYFCTKNFYNMNFHSMSGIDAFSKAGTEKRLGFFLSSATPPPPLVKQKASPFAGPALVLYYCLVYRHV